ncbi:DUF6503 family protein [bacterium]|nr:DUF6503 family protein [bacterium]
MGKPKIKAMRLFTIVGVMLAFTACKEAKKESEKEMMKPEMVEKAISREFPEPISKVFDAHGGFEAYTPKRVLSFEIVKENGNDVHTIDLKTRNEKIVIGDIATGYDGSEYWLLDEKGAYKGNPIFSHNLMFYFYDMPFVLGDNGINYGETAALEYDGKSYPGIRVSYDDGIGVSSKDEYFLHYNPETYQMEWLGYTVTFKTGEKSDKISWIRYDDWMDVEGLQLPKSITWFKVEDGKLVAPRNTRNFENVSLSETPMPDGFYSKPEGATVVEPK